MTPGAVLGCLECDHEVPVVLPEGAYRISGEGEIIVLDAGRIVAAIEVGVEIITHHLAACHSHSLPPTRPAASPRWRGWAAAALCALVVAVAWAAGI